MTKKSAKQRYVCLSCGAQTTVKGHLCRPILTEKSHRCGFCGTTMENFRHLCKTDIGTVFFACGTCGRPAASPEDVCDPIRV